MDTEKPRLLVFPFPLMSHYLRCASLLESMQDRYEIFFTSTTGVVQEKLLEMGFTTIPTRNFDSARVLSDSRKFRFDWLSEETIDDIFQSQVGTIRAVKPSLILSDSAQTARMAAEYVNVPHLALVNGYMSKGYGRTRGVPETHPAKQFEDKTPVALFDQITRTAEWFAMNRVHKAFRKVRRRYGLPRTRSYLDEYEGDFTAICDDPTIFPQRSLSPTSRIIGPAYYTGQKGPCTSLSPDKPVIVVSMGSSGEWEGLQLLASPLFDSYTIVLLGDTDVPSASHIVSYRFLEPSEILPHASLMLCHGGNGTIYQALMYGLPVLCRPSFFEQEWNVQQFEAKGLVQRVPRATSAAELRILIDTTMLEAPALRGKRTLLRMNMESTTEEFQDFVDEIVLGPYYPLSTARRAPF